MELLIFSFFKWTGCHSFVLCFFLGEGGSHIHVQRMPFFPCHLGPNRSSTSKAEWRAETLGFWRQRWREDRRILEPWRLEITMISMNDRIKKKCLRNTDSLQERRFPCPKLIFFVYWTWIYIIFNGEDVQFWLITSSQECRCILFGIGIPDCTGGASWIGDFGSSDGWT